MFAVGTRRLQGHDLQDPVDREYEARLFRFNLEAMIDAMRQVDARTMLLWISQDFADWPPGTSSNSPDLAPAARARFDRLLDAGRTQALEDCAAALPIFEQALQIDAGFAVLHFHIADCAREIGQTDRARRHYRLACDLDRVPLGARTAYNEIIRDVAARQNAVFVDVFALMEELSPDGLVGQSLFVDLMHPNLRATIGTRCDRFSVLAHLATVATLVYLAMQGGCCGFLDRSAQSYSCPGSCSVATSANTMKRVISPAMTDA